MNKNIGIIASNAKNVIIKKIVMNNQYNKIREKIVLNIGK
jgi:hypothetical protein